MQSFSLEQKFGAKCKGIQKFKCNRRTVCGTDPRAAQSAPQNRSSRPCPSRHPAHLRITHPSKDQEPSPGEAALQGSPREGTASVLPRAAGGGSVTCFRCGDLAPPWGAGAERAGAGRSGQTPVGGVAEPAGGVSGQILWQALLGWVQFCEQRNKLMKILN